MKMTAGAGSGLGRLQNSRMSAPKKRKVAAEGIDRATQGRDHSRSQRLMVTRSGDPLARVKRL